jgi:hypothetical protein
MNVIFADTFYFLALLSFQQAGFKALLLNSP